MSYSQKSHEGHDQIKFYLSKMLKPKDSGFTVKKQNTTAL